MTAAASTPFDGKAFVRSLTSAPGVYRYFDADDTLLYVGKAANLKRRVGSYFLKPAMEPRIAAMVAQIARAEITVTRTAAEALLLESQLIKTLKPRYNIMLRDDKSYPYIHLSAHADFPRLSFYRGSRKQAGEYFGPYPSAHAVRQSLALLQKLFKIRNCTDSFFRNRSRPCLQYQIGRCSAPCVDLIDKAEYAANVRRLRMFLRGDSSAVIEDMVAAMEQASAALDFERAAQLRDSIANLRSLQAEHHVRGAKVDMDVWACRIDGAVACVSVLFFRNGVSLGSRDHFPKLKLATTTSELLAQFIAQYYLDHPPPAEVIGALDAAEAALLGEALTAQSGHVVQVKPKVRGDRARFLALAARNADSALGIRLASRHTLAERFADLARLLDLPAPPQRIECFDISHTRGEATVASCVVFGPEGPEKSHYRRFNIEGITPGDDYAAMHQALTRRFRHLARGEGARPDLLLIDGGKGQIAEARAALAEVGVDGILIVGVAKGPARRSGEEALVLEASGRMLHPGPHSPALALVDAVRDESHRFAIEGHRRRRAKARQHSVLEDIPGVGRQRRATLLRAFGGLDGVSGAGVEELMQVSGINRALAERIYAALHD